jgi:hypothetical protein
MKTMNKKRILLGAITGTILGIFCILGASQRAGGFAGNEWMLFGLWFNRLLLGLIIGSICLSNKTHRLIIAAIWGLLMGFAWFISSGMQDIAAFLVTVPYGLIIEWVAGRFTK